MTKTEQQAAAFQLLGDPIWYRGYHIRPWKGQKSDQWWAELTHERTSKGLEYDHPNDTIEEALIGAKKEIDSHIEYLKSQRRS